MSFSAGVAYVDVLPNMSKFGPAMAAAGNKAGLSTFAKTGALALGALGAASVKLAVDFEQSMRNVNSIAQLPEKQFDALSESVLNLAGPTAQAPKTLADGLYDLVSSGFDAKESMKILEASAYAATAGLTTTDVSTKAVSAVLNAYKLPASQAAKVSDTLFKTVDQGVITFEDLAMNIGDTLPFAASLGVGLDEVGAATSTMTKQGLGASETFTRIRNLLQTMIKPGDDLQAAFKELGVSSGEALIKQKGLQGALEALVGTTDGSKEAVAKLFPNIRALGGALALTGDNAKGAEGDLKALQNASGATQKAFQEQSKSVAIQFQRLSANLQVLAIRIGSVLLPPINDLLQALNGSVIPAIYKIAAVAGPVLSFLNSKFGILKSVMLGLVTGPFGALVVAFTHLKTLGALAFNAIKSAAQSTFAWIKGAAGAVGSVVSNVWQRIASVARGAFQVIKAVAQVAFNVIKAYTAPMRGFVVGAFQSIRQIGTAAFHALEAAGRAAFSVLRAAFGPVRAVVVAGFNVMRSVGAAVFRALLSAGSAAFNALKSVISSLRGVAVGVFSAITGAISAMIGVVRAAIGAVSSLINTVGNALNAVGDLASKISSLPGNVVGKIPGLASGGPVAAGKAYVVGERGPELFTPSVSGRIVPNHKIAGVAGGDRRFVITNWREGTGYFSDVADGSVASAARFNRQRSRMRTA